MLKRDKILHAWLGSKNLFKDLESIFMVRQPSASDWDEYVAVNTLIDVPYLLKLNDQQQLGQESEFETKMKSWPFYTCYKKYNLPVSHGGIFL